MSRKRTRRSYTDIPGIKEELWTYDMDWELEKAPRTKRIVAEGDSWFDYPFELHILDHLKLHHGYKIFKTAKAGDTLENMTYGTTIARDFTREPQQIHYVLGAIARHRPHVVLLSAGGNDIAGEELESLLNHKLSGLETIRQDFVHYLFFEVFKRALRYFAERVWAMDESVHIITHGYGNPVPDGRGAELPVFGSLLPWLRGPWLRPALAKKYIINKREGEDTIRAIIGSFNEMLAELAEEDERLHYLDLRGVIKKSDWVNELHLSSKGYEAVAGKFHTEIQKILGKKSAAAGRKRR